MHKKLLATSIITAAFFGATSSLFAAEYTTPLLPTNHHFPHLTWLLEPNDASATQLTLQYQTLGQDSEVIDDSWQALTDFTCEGSGDVLRCQLDLPEFSQDLVRFRLNYPDEATLKSFNLALQTNNNDTPTVTDNEQIFFSNFKTLDDQTAADQLSWKQQALTSPTQDQIVVQTRASYDDQHWTDWTGNLETVTAITDYSLDNGSIVLSNTDLPEYDFFLLDYLNEHTPYHLTQAAVTGQEEAEAFANTTFYLDTLDGLHLGQTITLSFTHDDQIFSLRGIISDLKPSQNLVSVFAWEGAIPDGLDSCEGNRFCYPTDTIVHPIETQVLPALTPDQNMLTIYQNAELLDILTYPPQIISLQAVKAHSPNCLQYAETEISPDEEDVTPFCELAAISLTDYYQNRQKPHQLQYRLFYGQTGDVSVSDVFLHQNTPSSSSTTTNVNTSSLNRLRGGKTFNQTATDNITRPFYWN